MCSDDSEYSMYDEFHAFDEKGGVGKMGAFLRPLCWIAGHDWRIIRKGKKVIIRECKFCDKIQTLYIK